jgi:arylsulfatase A-like enzyme
MIGLTPDLPSVASLLKSKGYETALIGKWHLGFAQQFSPNKNGFDYFLGFHGGGIDYVSHKSPSGMPDLFENENPVNIDGYMTDILSDKAISYIQQSHSKPFFLSLQFNAPHWPWQAPGDKAYPDTMRWRSGGSEAIYAGIMKSLDDNVGRILKALKQAGLDKNTIVFFVSDNGGEKFSDMGGLSGSKAGLWEGGIRVPAIVKWAGKIRANSVSSQPVITMDWSATILAIAGAKPDQQFPTDGMNLVPWFTIGKYNQVIPRTFYWRVFQRNQQKALRDGDWKYLQDEKGEYLFDLSKDMAEKNNLKEKETAVFFSLKKKYQEWEATVLTPIPLGK